jgi:hypothetical protein
MITTGRQALGSFTETSKVKIRPFCFSPDRRVDFSTIRDSGIVALVSADALQGANDRVVTTPSVANAKRRWLKARAGTYRPLELRKIFI